MSIKARVGPALVLGGRVLLLLVALAAVVAAIALRRNGDGADHAGRGGAPPMYACPMHPEVTGTSPTACPICGMALERVRAPSPGRTAGVAETITVQPTRQSPLFYDVMFARKRPAAREMRAPAWIDGQGVGLAIFYNDEVALLESHEDGEFQDQQGDGKRSVKIRLTREPPFPWDSATSSVRFRVVGPSGAPAIETGAVGWIKLAGRTRELLAIPYSAVVQSATGPYVLVASADRHTFSRRPIEIGRVLFAYVTVLAGLHEGERIVAMNTFFLDAERRFGTRAAGGAARASP